MHYAYLRQNTFKITNPSTPDPIEAISTAIFA